MSNKKNKKENLPGQKRAEVVAEVAQVSEKEIITSGVKPIDEILKSGLEQADEILQEEEMVELDVVEAKVLVEVEEEEDSDEPFKILLDIAAGMAGVWLKGLREMQRRGILDKNCDLPKFFRAEALSDGSLTLRVISMPSGIVMVGDESVSSWGPPRSQNPPSRTVGGETSAVIDPTAVGPAPEKGIKTLFVPEDGDVKLGG